jgi:hypothetical protein
MLVYKRKEAADVDMKEEEEVKEEVKSDKKVMSQGLAKFIEADNKAYEEERKVQKDLK